MDSRTLPNFKIRHHNPLLALLVLLTMLYASCTESPGLRVEKDSLILRDAAGKEQKVAGEGKLFWLHAVKGEAKLENLERLSAKDIGRFPSFKKAELESKTYDFKIVDGKYILGGGPIPLESPERFGILFGILDGAVTVAVSRKDDCEKEALEVNNTGVMRDGANEGNFISWTSKSIVDGDGVAIIERLIYSQARTAVGDTGTEIVIVDNFSPVTGPDCCKEVHLECAGGDSTGDAVGSDPAEIPGYTENFRLSIGQACVYEYCYYLIVANKLTGEIRCYNTLLCDVRLQLWNDGTFSILLESGCDTSAAVVICPGS